MLGRQIAYDGVAFPDDASAVLDRRHDAVGVLVEVPFLVVAAKRAAHVNALVDLARIRRQSTEPSSRSSNWRVPTSSSPPHLNRHFPEEPLGRCKR